MFEHYYPFYIFDIWIYESTTISLFVLLVLEKWNQCTGIMISLLFHLSCLKGVIHIFISYLFLSWGCTRYLLLRTNYINGTNKVPCHSYRPSQSQSGMFLRYLLFASRIPWQWSFYNLSRKWDFIKLSVSWLDQGFVMLILNISWFFTCKFWNKVGNGGWGD
jgi:hypothetical protein